MPPPRFKKVSGAQGARSRILSRYTDVSNAPLAPDDLLVIWDGTKQEGEQHTFKIENVIDEPTQRTVTCTLVDSTDKSKAIATSHTFAIDKGTPLMGAVLRASETGTGLDVVAQANLIAVELHRFLSQRAANDFGASWAQCVDYLSRLGLLPKEEEYEEQKKKLRGFLKPYINDLFKSHSGYIFSTNKTLKETVIPGAGGVGPVVIKRVNMPKLVLGIRMVLESGIFGDVVLEDN